jgi:putative ABC transport system permease protein
VIMVFGAIGTLLGLAFGLLLQTALPVMFGHLLPADLQLTFSWATLLEGWVLGVVVVGLFAFLPLYRAGEIKPGAVFRKGAEFRIRGDGPTCSP